jgi:hypothetical protein
MDECQKILLLVEATDIEDVPALDAEPTTDCFVVRRRFRMELCVGCFVDVADAPRCHTEPTHDRRGRVPGHSEDQRCAGE